MDKPANWDVTLDEYGKVSHWHWAGLHLGGVARWPVFYC